MAVYLANDDGSKKIAFDCQFGYGSQEEDRKVASTVVEAMHNYKWNDQDVLLVSFHRNGTHLTWEIMTMLLKGKAEYSKLSKMYCMIDVTPVTRSEEWFPSPKVLNTHHSLEVLPKEFRGRKTVFVVRNPKDAAVSLFEYERRVMPKLVPDGDRKLPGFTEFLTDWLDYDRVGGSYLDVVGHMWTLRDDPNMLIIYYEDIVTDFVGSIGKLDEFMGTNRNPELFQQIADLMDIDKMRDAKKGCRDNIGKDVGAFPNVQKDTEGKVFRKGKVGDWKNYFNEADNKLLETAMENWNGKDIPFKYE